MTESSFRIKMAFVNQKRRAPQTEAECVKTNIVSRKENHPEIKASGFHTITFRHLVQDTFYFCSIKALFRKLTCH